MIVGDAAYRWAVVSGTTAYPGSASSGPVDVLRIWRPDSGFDIALHRIDVLILAA